MDLHGAVCVVTGGTEGIGRSITAALLRRGSSVAICARTAKRIDETIRALDRKGTIVGAPCDVSREEDVDRFRDFVHQSLGPVNVLVNNAGLGHFAAVEELSVAQFDETMAVNVRGIFLMTRAFLPDMRTRRSGDIVNIASLAGKNGIVDGTAYTASKHAVIGFSKSLMLEVRQDNIRVITICPGSVVTPFFEKAGQALRNAERVLTADDVAEAVVGTLALPDRGMISEMDIRPTNP